VRRIIHNIIHWCRVVVQSYTGRDVWGKEEMQEGDKAVKRLHEMDREELIATSKKLLLKCRELQQIEKMKIETNGGGGDCGVLALDTRSTLGLILLLYCRWKCKWKSRIS
jgi:hypothetical protein